MSPTLNGSTVLQRFEHGNPVKYAMEYVRFLPHILYDAEFSKVFGSALYKMSLINDLISHLCQPLTQFLLLLTVATMPCSAHFHIIGSFLREELCLGLSVFFFIGAYQLCVSPPHWQKRWRLKLLWKSAFALNLDR